MWAHLPKELLDQIFQALDPRDYITFLCVCRQFHEKCQPTLFSVLPLLLYYEDRRYAQSRLVLSSYRLLEVLDAEPETASQIRAIEISTPKRVTCRRLTLATLDLKAVIASHVGTFTNLRVLKVTCSDLQLLNELLRIVPVNLRSLIVELTGFRLDESLKVTTVAQVAPIHLKFFKLSYTGHRTLKYDRIKLRKVFHSEDLDAVTDELVTHRIRNMADQPHKENVLHRRRNRRIGLLGTLVANVIVANQFSLYTVEFKGLDANIVFSQNRMKELRLPQLRVLRLCGCSISKLSWWLPGFEATNDNPRRLSVRDSPHEFLPPALVVFSGTFQRAKHLSEKDAQYLCRLRFFGEPRPWISMGGRPKEYWRTYKYH